MNQRIGFGNNNDSNLLLRMAGENHKPLPNEIVTSPPNEISDKPQHRSQEYVENNFVVPETQPQMIANDLYIPPTNQQELLDIPILEGNTSNPSEMGINSDLIQQAEQKIQQSFRTGEIGTFDFDEQPNGGAQQSVKPTNTQTSQWSQQQQLYHESHTSYQPESHTSYQPESHTSYQPESHTSYQPESHTLSQQPSPMEHIQQIASASQVTMAGPMTLPDAHKDINEVINESQQGNERMSNSYIKAQAEKAQDSNRTYTYKKMVSELEDYEKHDINIRKKIEDNFKKDIQELTTIESDKMMKDEEKEIKRKEFKDKALAFTSRLIKLYYQNLNVNVSDSLVAYYAKYLVDDMYDSSILTELLSDEDVTEIMVPAYDFIEIEKNGLPIETDLTFRNWEHMKEVIDRITSTTGRKLNDANPNLDARLQNKSRLSASIPPIAVNGPELTIRKFPKEPWKWDSLLNRGSINEEIKDHITAIVKQGMSILVSGGTGAGKTTFLNIISNDINPKHRVVVIENVHELNLHLRHVVYQEERLSDTNPVTMNQLVINALRKAPKAIIVGEVRGGEAMSLLQGLNTGHYGYGTLHANTPRDAFGRLNSMVLMAGVNWEVPVINRYICSALQYIVQVSRMRDGSRKTVTLTEILGVDSEGAERLGRLKGEKEPKIHDVGRLGSGFVYLHDIFSFEETGEDENGKVIGEWKKSPYKPYHFKTLNRDGALSKYWN